MIAIPSLNISATFSARAIYWCLVLCFSLGFSSAYGQAPEAAKPSDVRIVIDISGSMKKNDPQNLRRPALDMLVKLLPEGSQAGVWTFGQYINMLVKHRPVDEQWRQEATEKAKSINSVAQFTNIGEALEKAAYDKNYSTKGQYQTHVILLTDGMVDINRDPEVNTEERQRILDQVLPQYEKADYTLHTISLSDNADAQLMDRLALTTNGQSVVAKTADELMNTFLQVFDQAVPKEELPFTGNRFLTDSSIEEFTALIFREENSKETTLLAPDKSQYTKETKDPNVNWYHTDQYDLITVKRPLEGEWRVQAELKPESRVTVVSDLSLVVKPIPSNLQVGDVVDLSLALREENRVVDRAEFLELLDIDVSVQQVEGNGQWTQRLSDGLVPGNGVYTSPLDYFKEVGPYRITVSVDGKSFQRQFTHLSHVRTPFKVELEKENEQGQEVYNVSVIPQIQTIDFDNTQVAGNLKKPSGTSHIHQLVLNENQVWELRIKPDQEGTYHLSMRITMKDANGDVNNIIPDPISFTYPQVDALFQTGGKTESEPVKSPVAEKPKPSSEPESKPEKPKPEKPALKTAEEEATEEEDILDEEEEDNSISWILYGVLAVVNILIVLVIYLLYRKMFGKKKTEEDSSVENDKKSEKTEAAKAPSGEAVSAGFEEPPMDEMAMEDFSEEDDPEELVEPAETNEADEELDIALDEVAEQLAAEPDPLEELTPDALDDDGGDDEDPEFSLDDFAPDALDDDDVK